jgi:hypothetical protein
MVAICSSLLSSARRPNLIGPPLLLSATAAESPSGPSRIGVAAKYASPRAAREAARRSAIVSYVIPSTGSAIELARANVTIGAVLLPLEGDD